MKSIFLTFHIIVFSLLLTHAQVRHIKGQKGLEAFAGVSEHGQIIGAAFSQYLHSKLYLKGAMGYEIGSITEIDFTSYILDVTANYNLFSINPLVFFNAVAGASGIYEETETLERVSNQNGFSPGIIGGLEVEIFLNEQLLLITSGSQRHYFQSNLGGNRWMATAGIKYIF